MTQTVSYFITTSNGKRVKRTRRCVGWYPKAADRDRCKRGHVYTEKTVYEFRKQRVCRACKTIADKKYREKRKKSQNFISGKGYRATN